MNLNPYWPKHSRLYFGGGQPSQAQQIESAPIPTPSPPVTTNNAEVIQAQQDLATSNLIKKSVKRTILAGDTGGYQPGAGAPPASVAGYKSKLG
jgi:hypothetical protein